MTSTAVAVKPSDAVSRPPGAKPSPTPPAGAQAATAAGKDADAIGKRAPTSGKRAGATPARRRGGSARRSLPSAPSVSPHSAVVLSMVGTGLVIVVAGAVDGHFPRPRSVLGLGVVYLALGSLADIAPRLAVPFSVLVFTGVLLTKGSKALDGITNAVQSNRPVDPYSAHDTSVLNNSPGFASTGHPGGPSLNRKPKGKK